MIRYWLFNAEQETTGPFTIEELRRMIADDVVEARTQICLEGTESWITAQEVPDLASHLALPPPASPPPSPSTPGSPPSIHPTTNVLPTLGFIEAFRRSLKGYGDFKGRARRSEFWWATVAGQLILIPLTIFFVVLVTIVARASEPAAIVIGGVAFLALIFAWGIPWAMALAVRRLHDTGRSGWWLIGLSILGGIPFVGLIASIYLLCLYCMDSDRGDNRFGPSPKLPAPTPSGESIPT